MLVPTHLERSGSYSPHPPTRGRSVTTTRVNHQRASNVYQTSLVRTARGPPQRHERKLMRNFRSVLARSTAITAALVVTVTSAGPAMASGHSILREDLDGILPLTDPVNPSPVIAGVTPGGKPWVLDEGSRVRVREDGRITVVVRHLVIPGLVPGNPVPLMAASLVCDDMVVDSTRAFAVSPEGNGQISDRIAEVDDCDDPIVLVRNATDPAALGSYFAIAADD
jgi:hypothetical protein